jgi:hypothetical protein
MAPGLTTGIVLTARQFVTDEVDVPSECRVGSITSVIIRHAISPISS